MPEESTIFDEIRKYLVPVEESIDADVYFFTGYIEPPNDDELFRQIGWTKAKNTSKKNALLFVTTFGGDPDTAYRMARFLREAYSGGRLYIYINTHCKSAGTLITLASDSLIMSDRAQLGPLDIQVRSKEEVGELASGLTPTQALATLQGEAWGLFDNLFVSLRTRKGFQFSTKIAASIASRIAVGLFRPIYEQLDPIRIGDNERAMRIAAEYGARLAGHGDHGLEGQSGNIKEQSLARLIQGYPSHSFVIDRKEATKLFTRVRPPTAVEAALANCLSFLVGSGAKDEDGHEIGKSYAISWSVKNHDEEKKQKGETNEGNNGTNDTAGAEAGGSANDKPKGNGEKADTQENAAAVQSTGKSALRQ